MDQKQVLENYVNNQEKHHAKYSSKEELMKMLIRYNTPYDPKFFEWSNATPVGVGDGVRAFNLWDKSHSYVIRTAAQLSGNPYLQNTLFATCRRK